MEPSQQVRSKAARELELLLLTPGLYASHHLSCKFPVFTFLHISLSPDSEITG